MRCMPCAHTCVCAHARTRVWVRVIECRHTHECVPVHTCACASARSHTHAIMQVVRLLLALKRDYPGRVVLIIGNR